MRFRQRPHVIEAVRWHGNNLKQIHEFLGVGRIGWSAGMDVLQIPTLKGTMTAELGDWIIKDVKGNFYPCKPDIFGVLYEEA